jgi:hypothetical protein
MLNKQRMKNDLATTERRDAEDRNVEYDREKNDELTTERRFQVDKTMEKNRDRNDEMTASRREQKDGNLGQVLAVFLAIAIIVEIVIIFSLI